MNSIPQAFAKAGVKPKPAKLLVWNWLKDHLITEADLALADRMVQAWRDQHHQRNDAQAQALQIRHNPQDAI